MADRQDRQARWGFLRSVSFRQFVAAGLAMAAVVALALVEVWPFGDTAPDEGDDPSIVEVLLFDRVMIGLVRVGIIALVGYAVVSIPALVADRRWMSSFSTTGVTADDARTAEREIEALQRELEESQEELQSMATQFDISEQLLMELLSEDEDSDEGGDRRGDS